MTDNSEEGKTFTITLPKVGFGLQTTTFGLIIWLGGQANSFVEQLTEGFDGLSERVTALEGVFAGVGVDSICRAAADKANVRNVEQDALYRAVDDRVKLLEKCGAEGKRKCP